MNTKETLLAPFKTQLYRALAIASSLLVLIAMITSGEKNPLALWVIVFLVFFSISLTSLLAIKLIAKKYYEQTNEGWKRLSILFCILSGLLSSFITLRNVLNDRYAAAFEFALVPLFFLIGFFGLGAAILVVKSLYGWVKAGFNGGAVAPAAQPIETSSSEIPASEPKVTPSTPASAAIKLNEYLSGVGGWLYFLIISLMVLGPLKLIGQTYGSFADTLDKYPQLANNPQWQSIKLYSWCLIMVSVAFSITTGYKLWKNHERASVRFAIQNFFLIQPAITLGIYIMPAIVLGNINQLDPLSDPQALGGLIGYLIMAGVWTTYLLKSKRVANTYR